MKVMIVWESTRGRTKAMAEAISEGVTSAGAEGILIEAKEFSELGDACALVLGSSTRMKRVLPMLKRIMSELPVLNGLPAGAFGSYGWSGEAPDEIAAKLTELGAILVDQKPIKAKDYPSDSILEECRGLGVRLVEKCSK
ncbi:MAG: FprA family A-type flavoprotein [Candidatus Thorarchaeota archaeon]|nr:MAG: FprA family A-type flavoprotein [Candidatus Thorarchaeota archaeon]